VRRVRGGGHTLRRALEQLACEGLIEGAGLVVAVHGKGGYVRKR
jgi:DNA-binding GntR family transcriptional regulator